MTSSFVPAPTTVGTFGSAMTRRPCSIPAVPLAAVWLSSPRALYGPIALKNGRPVESSAAAQNAMRRGCITMVSAFMYDVVIDATAEATFGHNAAAVAVEPAAIV